MEMLLLRDKEVEPVKEVLAAAMGESFEAYEQLLEKISEPRYGVQTEWRYYTDGKAWLCKLSCKKKTICWLSVWNGYFKTAFYFMERNSSSILSLDINENIKKEFMERDHTAKLIPLIFMIREKGQIADLLKVMEFKKTAK